jgi:hypothetical protein
MNMCAVRALIVAAQDQHVAESELVGATNATATAAKKQKSAIDLQRFTAELLKKISRYRANLLEFNGEQWMQLNTIVRNSFLGRTVYSVKKADAGYGHFDIWPKLPDNWAKLTVDSLTNVFESDR